MRGTAAWPILGWSAAAVALAALSIVAMTGEVRVPRQIVASTEANPLFGLSHRSATTTLKRCEEHIARPAVRVRPTPEWHATLETCRTQARLVTARWPTDARAWLLIATTSAGLGEQPALSDALTRSQQDAPAVQWLAERRLAVADKAGEVTGYSYDGDVLSLLDSDAGARALAAFWVAGNAERRARIKAAAEGAEPALQQRLLDKIREQASSARPT